MINDRLLVIGLLFLAFGTGTGQFFKSKGRKTSQFTCLFNSVFFTQHCLDIILIILCVTQTRLKLV